MSAPDLCLSPSRQPTVFLGCHSAFSNRSAACQAPVEPPREALVPTLIPPESDLAKTYSNMGHGQLRA